jgi:caffeoyl-CoA O-methyltransferase
VARTRPRQSLDGVRRAVAATAFAACRGRQLQTLP